jgi:hypothetical protein
MDISKIVKCIFIATLFYYYFFVLQSNQKDAFKVDKFGGLHISTNAVLFNKKILNILKRMKYIYDYNTILYDDIIQTVDTILVLYYKFINNKLNSLDDISFHRNILVDKFQEAFLGLPFKYHEKLTSDIDSLNEQLDIKMEMIRIKSSKTPIKISLMNYKL